MIDEDPWIKNQGSCKPSYVPSSFKGRYVSHLIDENGEWKESLLRDNFATLDVLDILAMIPGKPQAKDEIIWNPDSKGVFSVKSAYRLACSRENEKKLLLQMVVRLRGLIAVKLVGVQIIFQKRSTVSEKSSITRSLREQILKVEVLILMDCVCFAGKMKRMLSI